MVSIRHIYLSLYIFTVRNSGFQVIKNAPDLSDRGTIAAAMLYQTQFWSVTAFSAVLSSNSIPHSSSPGENRFPSGIYTFVPSAGSTGSGVFLFFIAVLLSFFDISNSIRDHTVIIHFSHYVISKLCTNRSASEIAQKTLSHKPICDIMISS